MLLDSINFTTIQTIDLSRTAPRCNPAGFGRVYDSEMA